jgi:hypothetical protein
MLQAGFADVKLYGNLDGDDYGINSQRLIAVARKTGHMKTEKHRTKHFT